MSLRLSSIIVERLMSYSAKARRSSRSVSKSDARPSRATPERMSSASMTSPCASSRSTMSSSSLRACMAYGSIPASAFRVRMALLTTPLVIRLFDFALGVRLRQSRPSAKARPRSSIEISGALPAASRPLRLLYSLASSSASASVRPDAFACARIASRSSRGLSRNASLPRSICARTPSSFSSGVSSLGPSAFWMSRPP